MDKNQIIGIVLIFAMLIAYGIYTAPSEEQKLVTAQKQDSIQRVRTEKSRLDSIQGILDSIEKSKILETENIVYN